MFSARPFHLNGIAICIAATIIGAQAQPLVVHEWGTFTSLQDEAGRTLGSINTDDEPVPRFCHDSSSTVRTLPEDKFSRNAGFFMHVNRPTSKCSGKF